MKEAPSWAADYQIEYAERLQKEGKQVGFVDSWEQGEELKKHGGVPIYENIEEIDQLCLGEDGEWRVIRVPVRYSF